MADGSLPIRIQDTRPVADGSLPIRIEVSSKDIAVPFEGFGSSGDIFQAMKPIHCSDVLRVRFFGIRGVGNPEQALRQSLRIKGTQRDSINAA